MIASSMIRAVAYTAVGAALLTCTLFSIAHGAELEARERVVVLPNPKSIRDFTLTDANGKARSLSSFKGAPTLVFFGFTHCPQVCPAALTKLKLLHAVNDGELKTARVVFISVDGERDTPATLKKYLGTLSSDFVGLTGHPRTVSDIAARFSAVAFKESANGQGDYGYFHSDQIFVLDRHGKLRASFFDAAVSDMAATTKTLLNEPSP